MCMPFAKAFKKLRSKGRKPTLDDLSTIGGNYSTSTVNTAVDLASTAYSSTNVSFVKPDQNLSVRPIGLKEHKAAAASLAQAFKEDEVAFYFLTTPADAKKSPEKIWKLHTKILEYTVAAHCRKGLVLSIGENNEGIALWMPPGQNMDDWWTMFRSGMWKLWFKLSSEGRKRWFKEFLPKLHDTKEQMMGERDPNSWYLVYIGVIPEAQGRGYSRKLVEHVTMMADYMNEPCYVESSARKNVAIYERFGFERTGEILLTRAEKPVMLDIMVREPHVHCISHSEKTGI